MTMFLTKLAFGGGGGGGITLRTFLKWFFTAFKNSALFVIKFLFSVFDTLFAYVLTSALNAILLGVFLLNIL
ncbi:hypothetical protein EBT25_02350 [bacterium]|nr:hypothetical protein [bacterium]